MLTSFQKEIVVLLAQTRSELSYFAGGTVLNFVLPRCSSDFDIFHDTNTVCIKSFVTDIAMLRQYGYDVTVIRNPAKHGIGEIVVAKGDNSTQIQWAIDSAFRFYPIERDEKFGFRLHYVDIATNKILALAGRSEVRDYYDVCEMVASNKPVTAYVWAACSKDPGYTPLSLLDYMSQNSKYQNEDLLSIDSDRKHTLVECKNLFQRMLHEAREQFAYAPCSEFGTLFLKKEDLSVFFPRQEDFESQKYIKHYAQSFGSMPRIVQTEEQSCTVPTIDTPESSSKKRHRMR